MNVLIGLNIRRKKVYTKFPNDEEVIRYISAKYTDHKTFSNSYGSQSELIGDIHQWLSGNFGLVVQDEACIFEPKKQGYYIVAHFSDSDGLAYGYGNTAIFFVCDENQLTEMEISQLSSED